jgi:hypothetical protein
VPQVVGHGDWKVSRFKSGACGQDRPGSCAMARTRLLWSGVVADGLVAADGVQIPVWSGGQQWLVSWHPPPGPPDGTPHGAEGVCVTAGGGIVIISPDGTL